MSNLKIVTRPAKLISDGFCVSKDAYIVIDKDVPNHYAKIFAELFSKGMIRVETARLKPKND